ncbi:asparaginase [Roseivirga misakiensis]|uniref:asparaginase n=1 Tax=Roseivirga misakiensis TaxID=1563681 RepID=A0A1E5T1S6_9BACT|nr:asparaginase [Roseivirga misakiensis]OEK05333.1 L-asparaginase 1 [Roseivirga misakiensis]
MLELDPIVHFDLFDQPKSRLLIIYTGGTLGMDYDETGTLVPCGFDSVLRRAPVVKELHINLSVISFTKPIDSSSVEIRHWQQMAKIIFDNYGDYDGFLILHGTDTMAYSASALSFMLQGLNKPVIFTGAQLPIASPRSDATENLVTSLEIASDKEDGIPIIKEVCIFFNNRLLRGNRAKKVESQQFDAFESENYPVLAKAGITIDYQWSYLMPSTNEKLRLIDRMDPSIVTLKLFPGLQTSTVDHLIKAPNIKGVILESYGAGNVPHEKWFLDLLEMGVKSGKVILNISQCNGGKVMHGKYETSSKLDQIGVISGEDLTTEAATTKMMHALAVCTKAEEVKICLTSPIRGEMN